MSKAVIICLAKPDGSIMMSPYQDATKRDFAKKNPGRIRLTIDRVHPESSKQRRWYFGALLPLIAFYQENMSHRSSDDIEKLHELFKIEFNGEMVNVKGIVHKVPKTTRGALNDGYIERIIDWATEQGYNIDILNPDGYKNWSARIFPFGGADNYIDHLVELNLL